MLPVKGWMQELANKLHTWGDRRGVCDVMRLAARSKISLFLPSYGKGLVRYIRREKARGKSISLNIHSRPLIILMQMYEPAVEPKSGLPPFNFSRFDFRRNYQSMLPLVTFIATWFSSRRLCLLTVITITFIAIIIVITNIFIFYFLKIAFLVSIIIQPVSTVWDGATPLQAHHTPHCGAAF